MSRTISVHGPGRAQLPPSFRLAGESSASTLVRRVHLPPASPGTELETPKPPSYYVSGVKDKGKGLVATQALPRGTMFLEEQPLFTQDASCTNSTVLTALAGCSREQQSEYFALANAFKGGDSLEKVLPALAIFYTNSFPCGDDAPQTRRGIFLTAARANHSCTPNAGRVWDAAKQAMMFRTLQAVPAGEELCINYVDVLGSREERNANLWDHFGFECACETCALQGEQLAKSDQRRMSIRQLYDEVSTCLKEPTVGIRKVSEHYRAAYFHPLTLRQAKLALCLLQEEGLALYEATFCFDAFQLCVMVSTAVSISFFVAHVCRRFRTLLKQRFGLARHGRQRAPRRDPIAPLRGRSRCTGLIQGPTASPVQCRE